MKFKDLKKHSIFVIPITPDIGKTLEDIKVNCYAKYIKVDDDTASKYIYCTRQTDLFKAIKNIKYQLQIPGEEDVILVEE